MSAAPAVVLMGSRSTVSVLGFRILRELGIRVPLVISGDEDPGKSDWRGSLAEAAREAGYRDGEELLILKNPHEPAVLERIRAADADMVLSLQWRRILRPPLLAIPRHGVVNLHNAPLPLLRGCDPFSWAIHDGVERMGVTLHQVIDEGVDSGPVLAQRLWPTTDTSTAWSLYQEGVREAEWLMREALPEIVAGHASAVPQDPRHATYHPMGQLRFQNLEVNWRMPAVTLSAELRSRIFVPFQVPFFCCRRQRIEILSCRAVHGRGSAGAVAGTVPFCVGTTAGLLELIQLRCDNRELSGVQFAGENRLHAGDSFL